MAMRSLRITEEEIVSLLKDAALLGVPLSFTLPADFIQVDPETQTGQRVMQRLLALRQAKSPDIVTDGAGI